MAKEVYWHLPGLCSFRLMNQILLNLMKDYPSKFKEGYKIGSVYGTFPGAIWNGGRAVFGTAFKGDIEKIIKMYNSRGVPVRFTWTNPLLEEKHNYDTYCNLIMKLADNGKNQVLVNTESLETYIRKEYPNYPVISSTTKRLVDVEAIKEELAKNYHKPVFIHVMTKKGKGYSKAEERPDMFHGIGPFDMDTGLPLKKSSLPSYSKVFGNKLCEMAGKDERVTAVSAAMIDGTGLEGFNKLFPKRMFDVGIAEGHAVTFAAGLAKSGLKPYVAVYSTFLQRAYDQIIEDVCLQELPVTFCIDRAGIVGADGETHHGIFDISYLRHIPNMTIMAPKDGDELEAMLEYSLQLDGPCAIRYPRGSAETIGKTNKIQIGKSHQLKRGTDVEIWSVGTMAKIVLEAADILKSNGISASVINAEFIKPFAS